MAENTVDTDVLDEETPSSYTSETAAPTGRGQSITAPAQALGRRKEAIARVRIVPGTGQWKINGRTLEDYFPNKVHQQLVKAPLVTVDRTESFDIIALLTGMLVDPFWWIVLRAVTGFSIAGTSMIIESWLNERATNESRGLIFSLYIALTLLALLMWKLL